MTLDDASDASIHVTLISLKQLEFSVIDWNWIMSVLSIGTELYSTGRSSAALTALTRQIRQTTFQLATNQ